MKALIMQFLFQPYLVVSGFLQIFLINITVKNDIYMYLLLNRIQVHIRRLERAVRFHRQNTKTKATATIFSGEWDGSNRRIDI